MPLAYALPLKGVSPRGDLLRKESKESSATNQPLNRERQRVQEEIFNLEMGEDVGEAHKNVTSPSDADGGNVEYDAAADAFVTEFTVADEDEGEDEDDTPGTTRPAGSAGQADGGEKTLRERRPVRESNPPPHLPKHPTRRLPAPGWDPQHWKKQKWCIVGRGGRGKESPEGPAGVGPAARTNRTVRPSAAGARNRNARKLRLETPHAEKGGRVLQTRAVATVTTCDPYSAPGPFVKVCGPLS